MLRITLLLLLAIVGGALVFAPAATAEPEGFLVCHKGTLIIVGNANAALAHESHGDVVELPWISGSREAAGTACGV